jgi:Flp pilus assembly protein TadB
MALIFKWEVILQVFYHVAMYSFLMYGVWRLAKGPILNAVYSTRDIARMPSVTRARMEENKKLSIFRRHLELMLESTSNKFSRHSVEMFYFKTVTIFVVGTIVIYSLTKDLPTSVALSIFTAGIPYFTLWVKLNRIRAKSSYDLLPATNKLLQKYRSNDANLYHALREAVDEIEGPIRSAFSTIVNAIQHRRNVEDAVHLFHYQIKTSWSLQLAIIILEGIKENKIIDNALERITRDMTETSIIMEKEKSENRDAVQLGFFPIVALPITLLINDKISGGRALKYHFYDPVGLKVLIITIVVCSFSFLVALIMAKPRNDI